MASILGLSYSRLSELPLRQVRRLPWDSHSTTGRFHCRSSNCIRPHLDTSHSHDQAVVRFQPNLTLRYRTGNRRCLRACLSAFIVCRPEKEVCIILDTYMRLSEKLPITSHKVDSIYPKRSSSRGEQRSEVNCEFAMHRQRDNQ